VKGDDEQYELDILTRYEHGEFFSQDSIKQDESHIFYTSLGRPVYGGGGIMPDIFVPQDTTGMTSYFRMAANRGLTVQFSFQYTDQNRKKLQEYDNADDLLKYLKTQNILEKFARFAESKGLKRRNILMYKSKELFDRNLYGNIIYNMLNMEEYLKFINQSDQAVQKALEVLQKEESFPKAPEQKLEVTNDEGTKETIA
jgi:carboxyl-terminal processing protease